MALSRAIGWNLTRFWLRPPSPESMIFSISAMIGSGVLLRTGKMPTDLPRIQSASKLSMVSTAVAPLGAAALDQDHVARGVGPHRAGLDGESLEQLGDRLRRDVAQRHDGDAVARLRRGAAGGRCRRGRPRRRRAAADSRCARAPARRRRHATRFPARKARRLWHRTPGRQRHGALHARIDGVADAEYVAEDDLCDRRDRRVLEIEIVAVAVRAPALAPSTRDASCRPRRSSRAIDDGRARLAAAVGAVGPDRLRECAAADRSQCHLVEDLRDAFWSIRSAVTIAGGRAATNADKNSNEPVQQPWTQARKR